MLDVTEDQVRAVDAQDMLGVVLRAPEQLAKAVDAARGIEFRPARPVRNVLVTGLGGSAMGGDLIAQWAAREGTVPVVVNRTYAVPSWVGADTFVVAVSYSGNTEETLAAFAEAARRGAMLAAVSTGGRLAEFAAKASATFVRIEGGLQPRAALPRTFAPQAALLAAAGVLPDPWRALDDAVEATRSLADDLAPSASIARNEAKRVALALKDTVPVVYGADDLAPVARRWANTLNENAKVLAFWGAMPEMNHNELVGWAGDDDLDRFTAVLLRHEAEHAQVKERFAFTQRLVQERGGRVVQVAARGSGFAATAFSSTLVGDAASVYLAVLREEDPTPVDVIANLKARVGESGFAAALASKL